MKRSFDEDTAYVNDSNSSKYHRIQDANEDSTQCSNSLRVTTHCLPENILKEPTNVTNKTNEVNCSSELDKELVSIIPLHVINSCIDCEIEESESLAICQILSNYCSDKLKDVLNSAVKYKERWNRKKLTLSDFNNGLFFCGEEPLYEFPNIFIQEKSKTKKNKKLDVSDSKQKGFGVSNNKLKAKALPRRQKVTVGEAWLGDELLSSDFLSSDLPEELKLYFNLVTKDFQNLDKESLSLILQDLKKNKNISCLVPFFIDFIVSKIEELTYDVKKVSITKLSVVLNFAHSLVTNPYLYMREEYYFETLSVSLIRCLIDPLQCFLDGDALLLKDTAAELLKKVLNRSQSEALIFQIIAYLEAVFCDTKLQLISHYGVITALNSIGLLAINIVILPYMDSYLSHINTVKMDSSFDYRERYHACAVQGQLSYSYYLLTRHFIKHEFEECPFYYSEFLSDSEDLLETKIPAFLEDSFTEHLGEALVQCFPLWNLVSCNMNNKKRIQSFKNSTRKFKDFKRTNSDLSENVIVNSNKAADKLRDLMFDYHPVKKRVIKFGKIKEKQYVVDLEYENSQNSKV